MEGHRDLWWASPTVELGKVAQLDLPAPFPTLYGGSPPAGQGGVEARGRANTVRGKPGGRVHPQRPAVHVGRRHLGR